MADQLTAEVRRTASPERHLWISVVAQAVADASAENPASISTASVTTELEQYQARQWLLDGGRHLEMVCWLAGVCPDRLRTWARKRAARGWPPVRNARGGLLDDLCGDP